MSCDFSFEQVSVAYPDGTQAVKDVSFSVASGGLTALIGANGAGKTSLFTAAVGLLPHTGIIRSGDLVQDKTTLEAFRRKVGFVFQNPDDMLFMPRVYDDIAFSLRNAGMDKQSVAEKVHETAEGLGISHLLGKQPVKLSGGEKRMAALAAVLVSQPHTILFDEPTAFLDPKARRRFMDVLMQIKDCVRIVATHDLAMVEELFTDAVFLADGRVYAQGNPKDVLGNKAKMQECGIL